MPSAISASGSQSAILTRAAIDALVQAQSPGPAGQSGHPGHRVGGGRWRPSRSSTPSSITPRQGSRSRSLCGSGPPCCSPTSPKAWLKAAARRRRTRYAPPASPPTPRRSMTAARSPRRRHTCYGPATWCWWRPAMWSRRTATSSRGSPRSMNRRSPASPPRSSARVAATVRRSPAAPPWCRTGSR